MEHFGFLFAAYSIIFVAIFLYVAFIWRRQATLQSELEALEKRLKAVTADNSDSPPNQSAGR